MSQIFTADHQQIKRAGKGQMIVASAVKLIKGWNTLTVRANNFRVHDRSHVDSGRFLHDQGITLRPVSAIHREEPHASIANVDLEPVSIMLQFVHPTRTAGRLLGDSRKARMNESGRRIEWPAARGTPQHAADTQALNRKLN